MLEYQGWATVREAFRESDEDDALLGEAIKAIRKRVEDVGAQTNVRAEFLTLNGSPRLMVVGVGNRKDSRWEATLELFSFIAKVAPGSYGELSFWDDEEADGKNEVYQSYIMKKGMIALQEHPFLSPCYQELEEFSP